MSKRKDAFDEFPDEIPLDDEPQFRAGGGLIPGARLPFGWRTVVAVFVLLAVLIVWPVFVVFYTDLLWFRELGFQQVFTKIIWVKSLVALVAGAVGLLLFWGNIRLALQLSGQQGAAGYKFLLGNQEIVLADTRVIIQRLAWPLAMLVGAYLALEAWQGWAQFLLFWYGGTFGEVDPVFGKDIGFYVFQLPMWNFVAGFALTLVLGLLIATALIYLSRAAIALGDKAKLEIAPLPRLHIAALFAVLFVVLAARYYLELPELLLTRTGTVVGAGFTAIHAVKPIIWAKVIICLLSAGLAILAVALKRYLLIGVGFAMLLLGMLAGWIYPSLLQRFSVAPNELAKEGPFLQHNINATRKAYNLDLVEEYELNGNAPLTANDLQERRSTINSIRLWDQEPLLSTFAQLQEIRPYYTFRNVDNDRYKINGEYQQVMLSARELENDKLPNRNWINERFIFTHGYGATLGPVNQVTPEGLPVLFMKDIPPRSSEPTLKVDRPEIYFGEMDSEHVYVKTGQQEFNYPEGEKNQFSTYAGSGGVSIGTSWRKMLFSARFGDFKLLMSNDINADSRVLFHRNIRERLGKVAPFILFDRDPYLVISNGQFYWMCDGYTTSENYPYSTPVAFDQNTKFNYIRNAVKAVVNAYDGSVALYIADQADPIVNTYARIFPDLFKPLAAMPSDLREHIRYPEDIFRVQTHIFATYHMDQVQVFYNKEDQWEIASSEEREGAAVAMEPYYTIMTLPQSKTEEFLVMLPFVPSSKLNMAAWMVARCDGENYGKMQVYRIPKQKQIFGPKQIVGRINQDAEISGQLTLWSQRGSRVIFGSMLVVPIKESLLYVQPLYLQAETGKIPELKRVIVVNENKIAMSETLEQSLAKIFGTGATSEQSAPAASLNQAAVATVDGALSANQTAIVLEALKADDRANQALREGDWARYGEERKKVRALLEQLSNRK